MVRDRVTSTYRREYSPERSAKVPGIQQLYGVNINYREYRRRLEHGHQQSHFLWDDWEYEPTPELKKQSSKSAKRPKEKPKMGLTYNRKADKSPPTSDSGSSLSEKQPPSRDGPRPAVPTNQRPSSRDGQCQTSPPPSPVEDCDCQPRRLGRGQPPRVLEDTISKSLKNVSKSPQQRPHTADPSAGQFAQYGRGDRERETGAKKTHNVNAAQGVYQSALDAKRRHETAGQARRSLEDQLRKSTMFDPRFDKAMNQQTSVWESEYDRNYRGHHQGFPRHKPPFER